LHQHPELSENETRTAGVVARFLTSVGWEVTTGVGGTGVVATMRSGDGPTAYLRADMDALPVEERTGLPYASTVRATDRAGNDVPVMHACGHDMHVTCLLGAAAQLAGDRSSWSGTATLVFQPRRGNRARRPRHDRRRAVRALRQARCSARSACRAPPGRITRATRGSRLRGIRR
jgi:metal-dependent amidase/aminoacylase/carboxypeptidase family protein